MKTFGCRLGDILSAASRHELHPATPRAAQSGIADRASACGEEVSNCARGPGIDQRRNAPYAQWRPPAMPAYSFLLHRLSLKGAVQRGPSNCNCV